MKYDIFISYRREGGYDTAKHLNDLLVRDGYKVSFDIDTLRSGDFDKQLLNRIDDCKDFILIVDAHAFDRTLDPNFDPQKDWLRCELAYALKQKKNIIPIFLSGVTGFPTGLPTDVADVLKKNGPEYNRYHFNAFYLDLKKRFLISSQEKKSRLIMIYISLFCFLLLLGIYFVKISIEKETRYSIEKPINNIDILLNKSCMEIFNAIKAKDSLASFQDTTHDGRRILYISETEDDKKYNNTLNIDEFFDYSTYSNTVKQYDTYVSSDKVLFTTSRQHFVENGSSLYHNAIVKAQYTYGEEDIVLLIEEGYTTTLSVYLYKVNENKLFFITYGTDFECIPPNEIRIEGNEITEEEGRCEYNIYYDENLNFIRKTNDYEIR